MNLSPRQIQIVELIAAGNANKQIAQALGIAEGTVKNHLKAIFSRLGCTCRAHAVAKWLTINKKGEYPFTASKREKY